MATRLGYVHMGMDRGAMLAAMVGEHVWQVTDCTVHLPHNGVTGRSSEPCIPSLKREKKWGKKKMIDLLNK